MLDTMCLSTGGWPGLICRGHWGHSVTSLTLKAVCLYEHCNQAPEEAGLASHLGKGAIFIVCNFICQPKAE